MVGQISESSTTTMVWSACCVHTSASTTTRGGDARNHKAGVLHTTMSSYVQGHVCRGPLRLQQTHCDHSLSHKTVHDRRHTLSVPAEQQLCVPVWFSGARQYFGDGER